MSATAADLRVLLPRAVAMLRTAAAHSSSSSAAAGASICTPKTRRASATRCDTVTAGRPYCSVNGGNVVPALVARLYSQAISATSKSVPGKRLSLLPAGTMRCHATSGGECPVAEYARGRRIRVPRLSHHALTSVLTNAFSESQASDAGCPCT